MTTINTWAKVAVAVQSALASAKTITAITKANPAVATSTAHGLTNGSIVLLKINGMRQLDYAVARVANQATNTFELEGIDSTSFDTFSSGTAEVVTLGTSISTLQDVNASGGESSSISVTTIHDDQDYEVPGNRSPITFSFNSIWDVSDAGLVALNGYDNTKSIAVVSFTFPTGSKIYFAAYPSASLAPGGSAGAVVTTPVALRLRGRLKAYAS